MTIQQLLNEATDFSSGKAIIDSINRNETGTSAKKFFSNGIPNKLELRFDDLLKEIASANLDRTKVIKLMLKKYDAKEFILAGIDPFIAYFKNRDKKEAKGEYKELFTSFENSYNNRRADYDFEKKVNELFAKKANIKDINKELKILHPKDETGWEAYIPLTFAAASKYSTTKDGKTKWCTAAGEEYFKFYSERGPLYIIRNYDKGLAYQILIDEDGMQFMDKNDETPQDEEIDTLIKNVPENILKQISYKKRNLLTYKNKSVKEKPNKESTPSKEIELKDKNNTKRLFKYDYEETSYNDLDSFKKDLYASSQRINLHGDYEEYKKLNDYFKKLDSRIGKIKSFTNKNGERYSIVFSNKTLKKPRAFKTYSTGEIEEIETNSLPDEIQDYVFKDNAYLAQGKVIFEDPEITVFKSKEMKYVNGRAKGDMFVIPKKASNRFKKITFIYQAPPPSNYSFNQLLNLDFRIETKSNSDYIMRFVDILESNSDLKPFIISVLKKLYPDFTQKLIKYRKDYQPMGQKPTKEYEDRKKEVVNQIKNKIKDNT